MNTVPKVVNRENCCGRDVEGQRLLIGFGGTGGAGGAGNNKDSIRGDFMFRTLRSLPETYS